MPRHKESDPSATLSWVFPVLGFQQPWASTSTTMWSLAFGTPEKQILVSRSFAQFVQASSGKLLYGMECLPANATAFASRPGPKHTACLAAWLDEAINFGNQRMCSWQIRPWLTSLFTTPSPLTAHHHLDPGQRVPLDARGSKLDCLTRRTSDYSSPANGPRPLAAPWISQPGTPSTCRFFGPFNTVGGPPLLALEAPPIWRANVAHST